MVNADTEIRARAIPSEHEMTIPSQSQPAPVVDDLSCYIIGGRLKSKVPAGEIYETSVRTPAQGVQDGVIAERLGFHRVFLSERHDLKEAGAILGGIGALTTRVELATAVIDIGTRSPLMAAALGATMHAAYGPRFVYGIGQGAAGFLDGTGIPTYSYEGFVDYVTILSRLWRGEKITYNGPAGKYEGMELHDVYEGEQPQIWYGTFAFEKGARAAVTPAINGVILPSMASPQSTHSAVQRLRRECEKAGRDPATLRLSVLVGTAPELDEIETRTLCHARLVSNLQPAWGESYIRTNNWDIKVLHRLREQKKFSSMRHNSADTSFHRKDLLEETALIPDAWVEDVFAIGSVEKCVKKLQEFRDAGVDEIITYGSTPQQNAKLIEAWRNRAR